MAPTSEPAIGRLQLKRHNQAERFTHLEHNCLPSTPSLWFNYRYPAHSDRYGCAVMESEVVDRHGFKIVIALHLNDTFFASILSDRQLGHSVVFYEPEQQWYFLEQRDQQYHPTSEAKLINLLSAILFKCAEEMRANVDKYSLAVTLRDEELLKSIVKKARSLLAADSSFFSTDSRHKRAETTINHAQMARRFIQTAVKPNTDRLLSIQDCYSGFTTFCQNNNVDPLERRFFKKLIVDIIREEFGVGLRKDIKDDGGRYLSGWKGLTVEMADRN